MGKKFLFITLLVLVIPATRLSAGEPGKANEFRLGFGDWIFEASFFRTVGDGNYLDRPSDAVYHEKQNYRYIPHIFAEYNRQLLPWLWAGAQVDFGGFSWNSVSIRGGSNLVTESSSENCYNISILPSLRFDWFRTEYLRMYSALRAGIDINTGTETDMFGKKTAIAPCFTPAVLGITAGKGNVFGNLELGGLYALRNKNLVYMFGSRLISVSISYRF